MNWRRNEFVKCEPRVIIFWGVLYRKRSETDFNPICRALFLFGCIESDGNLVIYKRGAIKYQFLYGHNAGNTKNTYRLGKVAACACAVFGYAVLSLTSFMGNVYIHAEERAFLLDITA